MLCTNALIVCLLNVTCMSLHEICEHFLSVHTPKQPGKNWQLVEGGAGGGGPFPWYNRTGDGVNPALTTADVSRRLLSWLKYVIKH